MYIKSLNIWQLNSRQFLTHDWWEKYKLHIKVVFLEIKISDKENKQSIV